MPRRRHGCKISQLWSNAGRGSRSGADGSDIRERAEGHCNGHTTESVFEGNSPKRMRTQKDAKQQGCEPQKDANPNTIFLLPRACCDTMCRTTWLPSSRLCTCTSSRRAGREIGDILLNDRRAPTTLSDHNPVSSWQYRTDGYTPRKGQERVPLMSAR